MLKEYDLDVSLKETLWKEVFAKTYKIALWDEFVWNKNPKGHSLENHVEGFLTQLKLNSPGLKRPPLKKRQLYVVHFGMNTGSEINGDRPSIIYKDNTWGEDVTVIPLTSAAREKLTDKYDLLVQKDNDNKLFQNSFARIRQIRAVSLKRLGKFLGAIADEKIKQEINKAVETMLAIDK